MTYLISKKTSLFILAITALICSRAMFFFFNDPEGPNLLIVTVAAVVIYCLSLTAFLLNLSNFKRLLLAILIQVILVSGLSLYNGSVPASFDGKNTSFVINGEKVTLVNGISEMEAAPGSASKIETRYFGNEIIGDLTGDGMSDTAFLITQSTGGSGLFYYAVVAIKTESGYRNTNAFLIGDRIAPQPMYIPEGTTELHVNFAERKPGEPMTAQPSQGAVTLLKVTPAGVLEGLMK